MSSWNLALEWREDGFRGIERYNQRNAARPTTFWIGPGLWACGSTSSSATTAWARPGPTRNGRTTLERDAGEEWPMAGVMRDRVDPIGGKLLDRSEALAGQERLRRYLIARYADHPPLWAGSSGPSRT